MIALEFLGGMVLLLVSAEAFVHGAVGLATLLRVPPLVIGMTVVAFGTSAPELVVTLDAALSGSAGLAVGNVVGSNIANVLLIVGCACVAAPITRNPGALGRDGAWLIAGTAAFVALCWPGEIYRWSGAALLAMFAGFFYSTCRQEATASAATARLLKAEGFTPRAWPRWAIGLATVAGLAGVVLGADLMVDSGAAIARALGFGEAVIGLTVIALGTSLPELATSVVAAYRGHPDVAVGNVVGSNLFNVLGVAGLAAVVTPLPVAARIHDADNWVMLGTTVLLLPVLAGRWRPGRRAGAASVALYVTYVWSSLGTA